MSERLFDPGPPAETPVPEVMSATQRLTRRNQKLLEGGIHPATRRPVLTTGDRCGDCVHHVVVRHDRAWHKCEKHQLGISHSEASDIRVGWPACTLYGRTSDE